MSNTESSGDTENIAARAQELLHSLDDLSCEPHAPAKDPTKPTVPPPLARDTSTSASPSSYDASRRTCVRGHRACESVSHTNHQATSRFPLVSFCGLDDWDLFSAGVACFSKLARDPFQGLRTSSK